MGNIYTETVTLAYGVFGKGQTSTLTFFMAFANAGPTNPVGYRILNKFVQQGLVGVGASGVSTGLSDEVRRRWPLIQPHCVRDV